jgi:hypothetical protein
MVVIVWRLPPELITVVKLEVAKTNEMDGDGATDGKGNGFGVGVGVGDGNRGSRDIDGRVSVIRGAVWSIAWVKVWIDEVCTSEGRCIFVAVTPATAEAERGTV